MGIEKMNSGLLEDLVKEKRIIYSYVRSSDNHKKIGMLVAWKDNYKVVCVSYSLLNPGDKFNKIQGIQEAMDKFYSGKDSHLLSESKALMLDCELAFSFIRRTLQYFKSSKFTMHFPILKREVHAETQP